MFCPIGQTSPKSAKLRTPRHGAQWVSSSVSCWLGNFQLGLGVFVELWAVLLIPEANQACKACERTICVYHCFSTRPLQISFQLKICVLWHWGQLILSIYSYISNFIFAAFLVSSFVPGYRMLWTSPIGARSFGTLASAGMGTGPSSNAAAMVEMWKFCLRSWEEKPKWKDILTLKPSALKRSYVSYLCFFFFSWFQPNRFLQTFSFGVFSRPRAVWLPRHQGLLARSSGRSSVPWQLLLSLSCLCLLYIFF